MTLYDFSVKTRDGKDISLKDYEGKVLLIVNTATGCGFTPQYTGLQELYNKYKDKGLEILDFPCNQFLNQAPGSDDEIHTSVQAVLALLSLSLLKLMLMERMKTRFILILRAKNEVSAHQK